MPELVGHDLREPGLVTLAVRRCPRVQRGRPGGVHAYRGGLPAAALEPEPARTDGPRRRVAADLGVGGEADAAVDALLTKRLGLTVHLGRVDVLEQLVERGLIVPRVVDDADRGLVAGGERRDEVLPPQLERVHAQLVRELVHHDLDHVGRLGAARSPDRVRRELVRHHAGHVGHHRRRFVDAAHHERAQRRDQRRQQQLVGADVRDDLRVPGRERAVALGADLDVVDLVTPVVGDHHPLRTRLDPLHRAPELARRPSAADLLGVDIELGTETAPDLRSDHTDPVLADAEQYREEQTQEVRNLGGAPDGQPVAAILGQHPARLDRPTGHAMVDDATLDDDVGLGEAGLEVAAAKRPVAHLVGPELLVDQRRSVLERLLRIGDHRERVVLDDDVLGRVDDRVAVIADHERDRIADVLDLALGQHPVIGGVDLDAGRHPRHRQARLHVEILVGVDRDDAVARLGRRRVDRDDLGVRLGRAHPCPPQLADQVDVVDVARAAGDQPRVLLAAQGAPDVRLTVRRSPIRRRAHDDTPDCSETVAPFALAASSTDLTMLW